MRLPIDFLRRARLVWLVLLLSACASVLGPRTVVISEDELQAAIARHFPFSNRLLDVLQVDVDLPRVSIRQDSERIAVLLRVRTRGAFPKTPYVGTLALTCGVRFEASDNSVRLADVHVERFEIEGASADVQRLLGPVGKLVTEQALEGRSIYTVRPKDLQAVEGHGYRPDGVRVTRAGVEISLVPL